MHLYTCNPHLQYQEIFLFDYLIFQFVHSQESVADHPHCEAKQIQQ